MTCKTTIQLSPKVEAGIVKLHNMFVNRYTIVETFEVCLNYLARLAVAGPPDSIPFVVRMIRDFASTLEQSQKSSIPPVV